LAQAEQTQFAFFVTIDTVFVSLLALSGHRSSPVMSPVPVVTALELDGSSIQTVNTVSLVVVGGVLIMASFGCIMDKVQHKFRPSSKVEHSSRWGLFALLMCSYALLVPGLVATLFSFNVSISILGITKALKTDTENMFQLIGVLYSKGLLLGGSLVMLYSIIIPVVKIVLLVLGEFWRHSESAARVRWSSRCIRTVQLISKWACPDLFAYILMMYLFRSLNQPPHLLAAMNLDVGFVCFGVFCLGSTLASLAIAIPGAPAKDDAQSEVARGSCCIGSRFVAAIVLALTIAFSVLLVKGLVTPCMDLHLDLELLYENKPNLKALAPVLEAYHIQDLLQSEVSIWNCMISLARSIGSGEMACVLALVMYSVFVVAATVIDMLLLVLASLLHSCGGAMSGKAHTILAVIQKLKKLSMLDVSVMGVVVVVASLKGMRSKGVIISFRWGLLLLFGAEVCHYAAFYLVSRSVRAMTVMQKSPPDAEFSSSV